MVKIFAKKGTDEKAAMLVPDDSIQVAMRLLNEKFGPDWVYVDALRINEMIMFNDGLIYRGFVSHEQRYSNAIKKLTEWKP
jgi:hypothetical protein